jgi:hypothetical protein
LKTLPKSLPSAGSGSWNYLPQDGRLFHFCEGASPPIGTKAKAREKRLGYMSEAELLKTVREVFPNAKVID